MRRLLRTLAASAFACLLLPLSAAPGSATTTSVQASPIGMTSGFYTDPSSGPAAWAAANPGDGRAAAIRDNIASRPMARWFGAWSGDIGAAVGSYVGAADAADKLPVLIAYNIPGRDACGGHSGGGAGTPAAYRSWISAFASAIGSRPALVVIEPDSLGDFSCLSQAQIAERNGMLRGALAQFRDRAPNTWTYLDAGNPAWIGAATMPRVWPARPPRDPKAWLVTVAWRRFLDATRADAARRRREDVVEEVPAPGPVPGTDDTLQLYFLCAHPSLTPSSAVALTLRAIGGLTTRQIAQAYLVPEATMAQRISRAKRTVSGVPFDRPGDVSTVLRVLYLVFNEGYSGDLDLAAEAIRLTRQLAAAIDHPEVAGLLALMLLHHARRAARTAPDGSLVPLAEQDRALWDTTAIAEGVRILQAALARDRLGEYQAQAAVAALHADATTASETDWVQIVEWYDELAGLTDSPVVRLNRAVALGEADGPRAGLAALAELDGALPRYAAVAAYLHERDGDLERAAQLYAEAARKAPNLAERDHLTRQAARLNSVRGR
ncbi:hypothetical protein SCYAM73S_05074 [Streptomyces cyaneofuscatus]